jgi:prefoldin subunit 5
MSQETVKDILRRLDELKAEAAALEEEIEQIRTEESSQEIVQPAEKTE